MRLVLLVLLAGCFGPTAPMSRDRFFAATVSLVMTDPGMDHAGSGGPFRVGDVMVAGGISCLGGSCAPTPTVEVYDRALGTWSAGAPLTVPRWGHVAVRLRDHSILIVGGSATYGNDATGLANATMLERYYPAPPWFPIDRLGLRETEEALRYTWRPQPEAMETGRFLPGTIVTFDGRVLIVGGLGAGLGPVYASVESYDVQTRIVEPAPFSLIHPRGFHTVSPLGNGHYLVAGGVTASIDGADWTSVTASAEIIDVVANDVHEVAPLPFATAGHSAVTIGRPGQERVLVTGGFDDSGAILGRAAIYDPATDAWTDLGSPMAPRVWHQSLITPGGAMLVGGFGDTGALDDVELFRTRTETFVFSGVMGTPRTFPAASLMRGLDLLVAGGQDLAGTSLATAERGTGCDASRCGGPYPACSCTVCADSDHDGLNDAWEVAGGIDYDLDGVIDAPLIGADPYVPDVYVEIDRMAGTTEGTTAPGALPSYLPPLAGRTKLIAAFAARGIRLHLDVDDVVPFWGMVDASAGSGREDTFYADTLYYYDVKAQYFDVDKRLLSRYMLVAHNTTAISINGLAGWGEVPGDDILISGRRFPTEIDGAFAFLFHELGHTFGLDHGGAWTNPYYAPNYASVMSGPNRGYRPWNPARPLSDEVTYANPTDLSAVKLPTLNETAVIETSGTPGLTPPYVTHVICPLGVTTPPRTDCTTASCMPVQAGPEIRVVLDSAPAVVQTAKVWRILVRGPANRIDWNCNGSYQSSPITANLNADFTVARNPDGSIRRSAIGSVVYDRVVPRLGALEGYNDWGNLQLGFQCSESVLPPDEPIVTPTPW